jgi:hypothetical protein
MESILDWWRNFWTHAQFWDSFWPAVWGALIGAAAATLLERRYRIRERISSEVGECNKLIFILGQMLSTLEDFNESLFENPRKKLKRAPEWNEIGALEGAPTQGPEFIIGEYTFLLEDDDPRSAAPYVLGRIYNAEANFRAIVARLNQRSQLWHEYNELRAATQFGRGEAALPGLASSAALTARLKELTCWLAEDIPESVAVFKKLLPELRAMLEVQYPKRHFIRLWPNDDPKAPPL